METEEMKKGLNDGEDPLEISILKWKDIVYRGGMDKGMENCALCRIYYDYEEDHCSNCPIKEHTGAGGCNKTPYEEWIGHHNEEHADDDALTVYRTVRCEKCKEIAMRELEFLKSLRGI